MDSIRFLSGPELYDLYLRDQTSDHLKETENLKTLLTYILKKDMRELTDSDLEIMDFCENVLHPEGVHFDTKVHFLGDKYAMIKHEELKQGIYRHARKIAACIVFVVIGGVTAFAATGVESEAGIFDWVKSLIIKEDGEQLVISTPNATMKGIEIKEGHLPKKMLDGYVFLESYTEESSAISRYRYYFSNQTNSMITIDIKDFSDEIALHQYKLEITKSALDTITQNNISYYYTKNENQNRISWILGTRFYSIFSSTSFSELKKIISYYH